MTILDYIVALMFISGISTIGYIFYKSVQRLKYEKGRSHIDHLLYVRDLNLATIEIIYRRDVQDNKHKCKHYREGMSDAIKTVGGSFTHKYNKA